MAKPELGTKRVCPVTGRKFYDLNQNPVVSPYTGQVVPIEAPTTRGRPEAPRAAAEAPEETEVAPAEGAEFVSLEDADAEASGGKTGAGDDEEDVELEDEDIADDTFLEEDEDENADVSDIIGSDIEDEEET